ncbi:hypothetical protein vseg_006312 [Gypsophila vaccaria]
MGKFTRWFRRVLGLKRLDPNSTHRKPPKYKRGWSFMKSYRKNNNSSSSSLLRPLSHVYDAATSSGHLIHGHDDYNRHVWAVVVIQSCFRGYLARKALRALKGVVKLQAVVRGHIMRRKTSETMRCMQALLRAQARASSLRTYLPHSPHSTSKSSQLHLPGPPTPEKFEQCIRIASAKHDQSPKTKQNVSRSSSGRSTINRDRVNLGSSWSDPRMDKPTTDLRGTSSARTCKTDGDRVEKILKNDAGRVNLNLRRRNLFNSFQSSLLTSNHVPHPFKFSEEIDDSAYCTVENSPHELTSTTSLGASSRRDPLTPSKSDGSRSFLSGYSDCPSYMACTESSKAKVRSVSAPKQRPHYERSTSSTKRYPVHGLGEHNPTSNWRRVFEMQASTSSKAYPGSGRLNKVGMPVRDSTIVYYSGYLN